MIEGQRFKKRTENFQKSLQVEDIKRKHDEFVVNLRKSKRIDMLNQRRYELTSIDPDYSEEILYMGIISDTMLKYFPDLEFVNTELGKFQYFVGILKSTQIPDFIILEILTIFRLSLSSSFHHSKIFQKAGMIPVFISYILTGFSIEISSEAMWCICNLAAGPQEYISEIYKFGITDKIIDGMDSGNTGLVSNSLWAAANIIGDNWEICEELMKKDFLAKICALGDGEMQVIKGLAFCLANISKHEKFLTLVECRVIFNMIGEIIDRDKVQSLQAIYHLIHKDNKKIQMAIDSGLLKYAIEGLQMGPDVTEISIRIIGSVVSGTNFQTQYILDFDILSVFSNILNTVNLSICQQLYWVLSNIVAGTYSQRELLIDHPILKQSIQGLVHCDSHIRREASFYFRNFARLGGVEQKIKLIEAGIFNVITENLKASESDCLINTVETCKYLLEISRYADINVIQMFEDAGGLKELEDLTHHLNTVISQTSTEIIEMYFH